MNTGMNTDTDTGVDTARGAGAKQRHPQGEQRADEHANMAERNTVEGNTVDGNAASKKEMDTDKARDEATASNTITTISDKTTQETMTRTNTTTAVDPTTRTQLVRADQAYARVNGDTDDADAALHQAPVGQAVIGDPAQENMSTTASKMRKGILDTDKATATDTTGDTITTITTISGKTAQETATSLVVQTVGRGEGDYPAKKANTCLK